MSVNFGDVSHYWLPPNSATEADYLADGLRCEAPGCGQHRDAPVHQPFQVRAGVPNADFGDTD